MKNFKILAVKCSIALCMFSMFLAVHSVNVMCAGKYYQPKVPKELERFKKNQNCFNHKVDRSIVIMIIDRDAQRGVPLFE